MTMSEHVPHFISVPTYLHIKLNGILAFQITYFSLDIAPKCKLTTSLEQANKQCFLLMLEAKRTTVLKLGRDVKSKHCTLWMT